MSTPRRFLALFFAANLSLIPAGAVPDVFDPSFDPSLNGRVTQLLIQPDGKVLIAGDFTEVGGSPRSHLARLHRDGTVDPQFHPDPKPAVAGPGVVTALARQADGGLLVGGTFNEIGGMIRPNLARLLPEGAVDSTFTTQFQNDLQPFVYLGSIVEQPDGRILVAGSFTSVNGVARKSLCRLHQDGTLDLSFNPTLGIAGERAWAEQVRQPNGQVLAYGRLTKPDETYRYFFVRLNSDGSGDPEFNVDTNNEVEGVALLPNGKLLIRGDFIQVGGVSRFGLAQLNSDGSLDPHFTPVGDFEHTYVIAPQADGTILVGGDYIAEDRIAGHPNGGGLVALMADGSANGGFEARIDLGGSGWPKGVWSIANGVGCSTYVSGLFSSIDGNPRTYLTRLVEGNSLSGDLDLSFATRVNDSVRRVALQPDGKLLMLGRFTEIDGAVRPRVARLKVDDEVDLGFGVPATGGTNDNFRCLAVQADGRILIGGEFLSVGGFTHTNLVRLNSDGSVDSGFAPVIEGGAFPSVDSVLVQTDSRIAVGGRFTHVDGTPRNSIARLNFLGTLDPGFDPVVGAQDESVWVFVMAPLPGDRLLCTGRLVKPDGSYRHFFVRLHSNGDVDGEFQVEFNGDIESMAVQPDGAVFIAGDFSMVNGEWRIGLARLLPNGNLDRGFVPVGNYESANVLTALSDGRVLVSVGDSDDVEIDRMVLLDAQGAVNDTFTVQVTGWISEALEVSDQIVIGGWFASVNGVPQPNLARLVGWSPRHAQARFESIVPDANAGMNLSMSGTPGSSAMLHSSTNLVQWASEGEIEFTPPHLQRSKPISASGATYYRLVPLEPLGEPSLGTVTP